MDFQEDNKSQGDLDNLEDMLDDLGLSDEAAPELSKKDSTVFIIDCCPEIMTPLQGEDKSQLELILEGYYNFLQRKIIASANDKVGLILYNVRNTLNSINHQGIFKVHALDRDLDAHRIKESATLFRDFAGKFGGVLAPPAKKVPLTYVFWEYSAEINNIPSSAYHLRMFLFTAEDNPHPQDDENRSPTITRAKEMASKNVQIELFPLRKTKRSEFKISQFYHNIMTFDPEEINSTVLDSSAKILDLQERLRQKEFKKRTLNRLVMKIGREEAMGAGEASQSQQPQPLGMNSPANVLIGVKIFSLYSKAKKPAAKKVEAKSNRPLQRITKLLNSQGEILFKEKIGTFYPLGGQKIKLSQEDMKKIKNIEAPGITLIGFKPKRLVKAYHNLRTSYFLYPDEEHIQGSSQFFDALIGELTEKGLVGIVKIVPRNNQELRFAALLPQMENYDEEDHFQTPPGFNMIILPYADDIVSFSGEKTVVRPVEVSAQLVQLTKLLINNLTIKDFDFRDFENPALQKFYSHLQAHALNEKDVLTRPDLLEPDCQGFERFKDVIEMVAETAAIDARMGSTGQSCQQKEEEDEEDEEEEGRRPRARQPKQQPSKKSKVKQQVKEEVQPKAKGKSKPKSKPIDVEVKEEEQEQSRYIEEEFINGRFDSLKVSELRGYLKMHELNEKGSKQEIVDRIICYIEQKNSI